MTAFVQLVRGPKQTMKLNQNGENTKLNLVKKPCTVSYNHLEPWLHAQVNLRFSDCSIEADRYRYQKLGPEWD
jgi:hypothetical protein